MTKSRAAQEVSGQDGVEVRTVGRRGTPGTEGRGAG